MTIPRIEEMRNRLGEIIGEASMCWSETPSGVFESLHAVKLVDELEQALTEAYEHGKKAGIDEGVMEENNRIREEYELLAGENPTMSYDKIFKKAIKR